jgi:hypothetical protein
VFVLLSVIFRSSKVSLSGRCSGFSPRNIAETIAVAGSKTRLSHFVTSLQSKE